jgi:hypothetical protein
MKILILLLTCMSLAFVSYSQEVDESAKTTTDQRFVNESNRKSKQGKKKVSLKQKVKIQKKQARAAESMKTQKASRRKPKKK